MKLIEKLKAKQQEKRIEQKRKRLMKRIKNGELKVTPKGMAFYEYVERISAGTLKPEDYIEVYEEDFSSIVEFLKKTMRSRKLPIEPTEESIRKLAATIYCDVWREPYEYTRDHLNLGED